MATGTYRPLARFQGHWQPLARAKSWRHGSDAALSR
jgi:hypothetical protein